MLVGAWRLPPLSPLPPFSVVRAALRLGAVLRAYVLCAPPPRLALCRRKRVVRCGSLRVVRPRARRRRSRSPRASVPPCVVAQGSARVGAFFYGLVVASALVRFAAAQAALGALLGTGVPRGTPPARPGKAGVPPPPPCGGGAITAAYAASPCLCVPRRNTRACYSGASENVSNSVELENEL